LDQQRLTNGYVFKMFDGAISWMSKQHAIIALSTIEVEYMETTPEIKEAIWLQRLSSGIRFGQRVMNISCNRQSTIFMEQNPAYHFNTNHIDVQYHFVRDMVEINKVLLEKVDTLEKIVDALTKCVSVMNFSWCREEMAIVTMGQ
jgi:hypothetical protein